MTLATTSIDKIYEIMKTSDKYNFLSIKTNDDGKCDNAMSFAHYLIQKGVLSTILPQYLDKLHYLYMTYYEERLVEQKIVPLWRSPILTLLNHHLSHLSGHSSRKMKYYFDAFEGAAETGRLVEGIYYSKKIRSIETEMKGNGIGLFSDNTKIRYHKLLGVLYFQNS